MRLIDADALMPMLKFIQEAEHQIYSKESWGFASKCITAIENASPIEERNKGQWVRITQGAVPEKYMCPFCRRTIEDSGVENLLSVRFPFCHCGADMRGEQK